MAHHRMSSSRCGSPWPLHIFSMSTVLKVNILKTMRDNVKVCENVYRGWHSPPNHITPNSIIGYNDLNFQCQTSETLISGKRWELAQNASYNFYSGRYSHDSTTINVHGKIKGSSNISKMVTDSAIMCNVFYKFFYLLLFAMHLQQKSYNGR